MAQADAVQKLVGEYGAAAKAKLANPASTGQPADPLRNPLETLFQGLPPTMQCSAASWKG